MAPISLANYEAVVFDLDNTLTDTKHYPLTASRWLLKQIGQEAEACFDEYVPYLLEHYFGQIREIVDGAPYKYPIEVVRDALSRSLHDIGISFDEDLPQKTAELFSKYHLELSEPRSGVSDLLDLLQEGGLQMGVITNAFVNHIQPILNRAGIADFFQSFVDGAVVKAYKPSAEPFRYAMRELNSRPATTLYVGDEYYADVVGATNLGIDAIWVNARGHSLEELMDEHGRMSQPLLIAQSIEHLTTLLR